MCDSHDVHDSKSDSNYWSCDPSKCTPSVLDWSCVPRMCAVRRMLCVNVINAEVKNKLLGVGGWQGDHWVRSFQADKLLGAERVGDITASTAVCVEFKTDEI